MDSDQNNVQELELVKGQFTAEEAREVLMNLINSKLSYHNKKNLRSIERSGQVDQNSKKRIEELKEMRQNIVQLVKKAEERGVKMNIHSEVKVELDPEAELSREYN